MEILELELTHYGKFSDHRITMRPGINIIYGNNETGKSTLHSFIRAMLFGFPRTRGRSARQEEYRLRQPWTNPGHFAGRMRIRDQMDVYRIERNFDRDHEFLSVVNETKGILAADGQAEINRILSGMSENGFCNTVFIRQAGTQTDEGLMEELQRFVVNYDTSRDQQTDVSKAIQSLKKKKKQFEQKKKAEEDELEEQIRSRQNEAEYLRREIGTLTGRSDYRLSLPAPEKATVLSENGSGSRRMRNYYRILQILLVLTAALSVVGAVCLDILQIRIFLGVFSVIFLLCLFPVRRFMNPADEENEETDNERNLSSGTHKQAMEEELQEKEKRYRKLQEELEQLYQKHVGLGGTELEIAALDLAIERIMELSSDLVRESGGGLTQTASQILKDMTKGKYLGIILDETMEIRVRTSARFLQLHEVSYGTMQQIYFALRLAAAELLAENRSIPLVLDEPFAMYDDTRLEAVLTWLYNSRRQVILFTCQDRERKILDRIKKNLG